MVVTQFADLKPKYLWLWETSTQPAEGHLQNLKPFLFDFWNSRKAPNLWKSTQYSTQGTKKLMVTCRKNMPRIDFLCKCSQNTGSWYNVKKFPSGLWRIQAGSCPSSLSASARLLPWGPTGLARPFHALKSQKRQDGGAFRSRKCLVVRDGSVSVQRISGDAEVKSKISNNA